MDPEIYKKFMVQRKTNNNVYMTKTPATTVILNQHDDAQSRISLKSKFSNVNNSPKPKKRFSISKKMYLNKLQEQDNIETVSPNKAFDDLIDAMNQKDNRSCVSDESDFDEEFLYEYLKFRKHLINKTRERREIMKQRVDIDYNDISANTTYQTTKHLNQPTISPKKTEQINIIITDSNENSENKIHTTKDTPIYDKDDSNSNDSVIFVNPIQQQIHHSPKGILGINKIENNSIDTEEFKEYKRKGNSVITGSSSSFSFKTPEIPVDPQDLECCNKLCKILCINRIFNFIKNFKLLSNEKRGDMVILIDKDMMSMLNFSLSSSVISNFKYIRYLIPLITNSIICGSIYFSYSDESSIILDDNKLSWCVYFTSLFFCYNYIYYLVSNWKVHKHYIERNIQTKKRKVSYSFYYLFLVFFLYYSGSYIYYNIQNNIQHTYFNYLFYGGIYLFFASCGACYYFVTTKLIQKGNMLHKWLHEMKLTRPDENIFYKQYNRHYKRIKLFAKYWNVLIFLGFVMLTFNLPLDIISIIYYNGYYSLPSIIIRTILLSWYTYCICYYNFYERYIPSYLYKHRIYNQYTIKGIEKYMKYRPISLNFYGFTINGHLIMKYIVLFINILLPTIYGLVSNRLINFKN